MDTTKENALREHAPARIDPEAHHPSTKPSSGHNGGPPLCPDAPINPQALYRGPEVDRILSIHPVTRWRLTKRGLLTARRPLGPGTQPRYLGRDVLKLRDST
jgi:hypothetical protein